MCSIVKQSMMESMLQILRNISQTTSGKGNPTPMIIILQSLTLAKAIIASLFNQVMLS